MSAARPGSRDAGDSGASSRPAASAVSILAGSGPDDVHNEPFSHLVRKGCLSAGLYQDLAASFPSLNIILGNRQGRAVNAAARLPAFKVLDNAAIASSWRDFFAFHTSDAFWQDIVHVFGRALRAAHPALADQAGKAPEAWRAGPRGASGEFEVQLDCQFVVNTPWPARMSSRDRRLSVKTAHVDKRDTILSALLYFRDPEDKGAGGDLELYAWNREPRFLKPRVILPSDIEARGQVRYAANTLVAFVNSARAAHGVTPRAPSPLPRRYINFIAEVPFPVFETRMLGPVQRLLHWPGRQWRRLGSRDIGGDRY
jgi:hypothetical protein